MPRVMPRMLCIAAAAAALALAGCGGGGDEKAAGLTGARSESHTSFSKNFKGLTGVSVQPMPGELFGTRLQVVGKPDHYARFGVYSFIWTKDDGDRERVLGKGEPDDDGIHWKRTGTSYTASKPYGPRLVMRWVGRMEKQVNAQFERLSRAVDAAVEGDSSALPEEERPCRAVGLNPFRGRTGKCSVAGIPVTFTDAGKTLSTPAVEVSVLGMDTTEEFRFKGLAPIRAAGTFAVVAYRLENKSPHPMRFLHPQLRLSRTMLPENPDTAFLLPRSRGLPLPPGETVEAQAAFDVPGSEDARGGAFVIAAERDGKDEPSLDLAQGWIRLADAPSKLPKPPKRSGPG